MRILTIDIETTPNVVYTWGLHDQEIPYDRVITPKRVLCFAAKWEDEDRVLFYSEWADGKEGMLRAAYNLLEEADVVVHFNGVRFDIKHLNAEFAMLGWTKPEPFKQVDLLHVVRANFEFPSFKLAYVAPALGVESKASPGGFETWPGCMNGDPVSQKRMRKYNIQDVRVTEQLFRKVYSWIPNLPPASLVDGMAAASNQCPYCYSDEIVRRGYAFTQTAAYVKYRCSDCGRYHRSNKASWSIKQRQVAG